MKWSMSKTFLLIATTMFVLAAFGIGAIGPVTTVPLGLAFFAAAGLVN